MLYRLIYCSTATPASSADELPRLIERSKANNQMHDITGVLCFNSRFFLQSIEGGRELINELFGRIHHDPRNQHVVLLKYEQVSIRAWSQWQSNFLTPTRELSHMLKRYSPQSVFNPYNMNPLSAEQLLVNLAEMD